MASHKILQDVGLKALCGNIKGINTTAAQLAATVVQLSGALQSLSSEVEGLINDVDAEVEDLTNAIIDGAVSAPLATRGKVEIATRDSVELHAVRIL